MALYTDVQVSKRKINWISYKIRQNQDKIGIFVSLVSTKVSMINMGSTRPPPRIARWLSCD
eukprot:scaffold85065_cov35-Tisochrysis_lutea.AAC.3